MRVAPPVRSPIRFRIWNAFNRRWLGPFVPFCRDDEYDLLYLKGDLDVPVHDQLVFEQDTGLKDNKGTSIYAGDILRFDVQGITHGPAREEDIIGEVWYDEEEGIWAIGCWEGITPENKVLNLPAKTYRWYYQFSDRIDRKTLEVIGNVHQSAYLLD